MTIPGSSRPYSPSPLPRDVLYPSAIGRQSISYRISALVVSASEVAVARQRIADLEAVIARHEACTQAILGAPGDEEVPDLY